MAYAQADLKRGTVKVTSRRRVCRTVLIAAIATAVLETAQGPCHAQMTAQEFGALPDADKRTVLVNSLQARERAVQNLQASSATRVYNVEYRDGKTGSFLGDVVGRYVCELRRKDGSHWASIDWFIPSKPDRPNQKVITSLDAKSGVARSVAEQDAMKGVYGAIDTKEDVLIQANRFHYWFDANFEKPQSFPISFLLKHRDAVKFEGVSDDGELIRISLHVETNEGTPYKDVRTVWMDPQKGFLPVRMHWRWEYDSRPLLDQNMDVAVLKTEQVDGVWFPTHFTETCTDSKSIAKGYAGVYETTVSKIRLGAMTDDDLQVRFTHGTEVQDRIKGAWFVANDATQSAPPPAKPVAPVSTRKWLIVANLVAVLAVAGFLVLRSRRRTKDA